MAAPVQKFTASLERLPNELLQPIAEALVPQPPLTTRFALRIVGTWASQEAKDQRAAWHLAHRELLTFAQTSHRMLAVARPLLWRNILIYNERALVTLYLRMIKHPEVKPWIRHITCMANITGTRMIMGIHREWERQTGVRWQGQPGVNPASIGLELLMIITWHAPNLRDLLFAFPDHPLPNQEPQDPTANDVLLPAFRATMLSYMNSPNPVNHRQTFVARYFPFHQMRSLSSLRIYCHRDEQSSRDGTFPQLLSHYTIACLPDLKNLKTLELCCSSASNLFYEDITIPLLPQIQQLRLYGSRIHEPRLVALCLACTNLQDLLVHFEESTTDDDRELLPEGKTLDVALTGLADSLCSLELIVLSEGHYLTRGRERPRKPENHRLKCIPHLRRLESLTLDYRGVFGTLGILEEDDGERLCQLLPPLLRDFTLVCEWGTAKDWKQSYLANLDMILHGVACLCATQAPKLSSISLAIHSWPAKERFRRRFTRKVEETRLRCLGAGITFRTFDLFPSYQDEDDVEPLDEDGSEDEDGGDILPEVAGGGYEEETELELEEEDEASEYYFSGDEEEDPEREARRPPTFAAFLQQLGEDHGHSFDELFYAYHEDRWDEYLFD